MNGEKTCKYGKLDEQRRNSSTRQDLTAEMNRTFENITTPQFIQEVNKFLQEGRRVKILVRGNSMRPYIGNDRDYVLLEKIDGKDTQIGDVVLAEFKPNVFALHRIIRRKETLVTLQGDGNVGQTETCDERRVLAKAVAFYRKGRTEAEPLTGLRWRLYSWIWLRLTPLRRVILAVLRRLPFEV